MSINIANIKKVQQHVGSVLSWKDDNENPVDQLFNWLTEPPPNIDTFKVKKLRDPVKNYTIDETKNKQNKKVGVERTETKTENTKTTTTSETSANNSTVCTSKDRVKENTKSADQLISWLMAQPLLINDLKVEKLRDPVKNLADEEKNQKVVIKYAPSFDTPPQSPVPSKKTKSLKSKWGKEVWNSKKKNNLNSSSSTVSSSSSSSSMDNNITFNTNSDSRIGCELYISASELALQEKLLNEANQHEEQKQDKNIATSTNEVKLTDAGSSGDSDCSSPVNSLQLHWMYQNALNLQASGHESFRFCDGETPDFGHYLKEDQEDSHLPLGEQQINAAAPLIFA